MTGTTPRGIRVVGFDPERLRYLRRTVRAGQAVADTREAPAAVWLAEEMIAVAERVRQPWFLLLQVPPLAIAMIALGFDVMSLLVAAAVVASYVAIVVQKSRVIAQATRSAASNRALAVSAGIALPAVQGSTSIGSRALRPGFVVALASTLIVVALVAVGRRNTTDLQRWARDADRVCASMMQAYKASNSFRIQDAHELRKPLARIAESHRTASVVERQGLKQLRRLELPRNFAAAAALNSFEAKVKVTEATALLAARGDGPALGGASRAIVATGLGARRAFANAGADVCSSMM